MAPASSQSQVGDDPAAAFQPTLLREGSFLVQSRGSLARRASDGSWEYVLAGAGDSSAPRRLTLLPNTLLTEIIQVVEAAPGEDFEFEITGEVFAYRGRNYLLASHAPRLAPAIHAPSPATIPATEPDTQSAGEDDGNAPPARQPIASSAQPPSTGAPSGPVTTQGDSVQDIKRRLREAVGPVPAAAPTGAGDIAAASSNAGRAGRTASDGEGPRLVREGALIINRRGRLTRDPHGAWTFVFEADANGLADPPMVLLPCLLLERLESYSGRLGSEARLLMTGRVTVFGSQNYLLPTAYTIPRERTRINP